VNREKVPKLTKIKSVQDAGRKSDENKEKVPKLAKQKQCNKLKEDITMLAKSKQC